jgi:hypothetical protein
MDATKHLARSRATQSRTWIRSSPRNKCTSLRTLCKATGRTHASTGGVGLRVAGLADARGRLAERRTISATLSGSETDTVEAGSAAKSATHHKVGRYFTKLCYSRLAKVIVYSFATTESNKPDKRCVLPRCGLCQQC